MKFKSNIYWATVYQILIPLLFLWLTRFGFYFYNADVVGELSAGELLSVAAKGLVFDLVAVAYINSLFILMRFLPFDFVMKKWWLRSSMVVYALTNVLMLIVNLGDIIYFRFNNGRMRAQAFFQMFDLEMLSITFGYFSQYWWAFIAIAAIIALMLWLATRVTISGQASGTWRRIGLLVLAIAAIYFFMRGSKFTGRPIGMDDAAAMADKPVKISVMLNSPFCVLRSTSAGADMPTWTFYSDSELRSLRSSVHNLCVSDTLAELQAAVKGKNIMLIILEGGGQTWLDSIAAVGDNRYGGYMPFLNSMVGKSMALTSTFCTGARTVEGLASIIGGVPTFGAMNWMATKYAVLPVDAPARLLSAKGYDTRFYIGARGELFSIGPQAAAMGFTTVTDMAAVELPQNENTNGWGYYDHVMGRYVAESLTDAGKPFFAAWLTIDLHGPYMHPEDWTHPDYPAADSKMLRCAQYTDYSIRCFFEEASKQPWFDNTVFIITADHGFRDFPEPEFNETYIYAKVPLLIYTPDGSIAPGKRADRPMAQFDIPPTLLWLAGYSDPYVAVGTNYFDDTKPHYGLAQRWNMWEIISDRYLLRLPLSGESIEAVYDVKADPTLQSPLTDYDHAAVDAMLTWFRAFIQDYSTRANTGRLTIAAENQ